MVLPGFFVLAQDENLDEVCQSMEKIEEKCQNLSDADCHKLLENCEAYYEAKSAEIEKDISKTKKEKDTLQNQVSLLKKKIKNLEYQIYESNTTIKDLGYQIKDTKTSIEKTSLRIENSKNQLAGILRHIYEKDQCSIIEIFLSEAEFSDFFDDFAALEILNSKNQELLESIKSLKISFESEKEVLSEEKDDTERMLKIQMLQKKEQQKAKEDKDYFLELTEKEYQERVKTREEIEKKAAEIRARIFEVIGIPKAPTFGEALELAKYVEGITGARPALLLAVLTQESNIGKNVGQCYLKNSETGDGIVAYNGRKVSRVMKPSRDVKPFLETTKKLGRDPYSTPVSCPMSYGYGGAMGPAQFIPSTWAIYEDRVAEITEKPADPWDIKDAFLAAALYLTDYGAAKQTYNSEWRAAMIYFSGSTNKKYRFYGDSVMEIAGRYEEDIKAIEGF